MPSSFHKKAPEHHRVRHRTTTKNNSQGVMCVSENKFDGTSFSFSGPAGSRHTAEALTIAGSVYSNEKSGGRRRSTVGKRIAAPSQSVDDEAEEIVQGRYERSEKHRLRTHAHVRIPTSSRHTATSALAFSAFRPAPRSNASTRVATNCHSSSGKAKAFKHEGESQLTYGVRDEGRQLLVSAPKDSHEAGLFRQVAELAGTRRVGGGE